MPAPLVGRPRFLFAWIVLGVAALAAGIAVHRLYDRARREVEEQAFQARARRIRALQDRAEELSRTARIATAAKLASLHVDGLATSLRRWDEASGEIAGHFVWDEPTGFEGASVWSEKAPALTTLPALWAELRTWRTTAPATARRFSSATAEAWRTLDNPVFNAAELGYQGENLEILAYEGRAVDPWAGWRTDASGGALWVIWYQPGPGAAVRGCLFDSSALLTQLRAEFADATYARVSIVPATTAGAATLNGFPDQALLAETGTLFVEKRDSVRLTGALAALVLLVFLSGGAWLAWRTRRAAHEAERQLTFVAQVSHELRTPLTSIRMFADLLGGPELAEEKRLKFAGNVARESKRLSDLIERLLALHALEKNARPADCTALDVAALVRDVAEAAAPALRAAGLEIETALPVEPLLAWAESSAMRQVLLNLCDNAVKYAAGRGPLRIEAEAGSAGVLVRVSDRGPGVPAEIRGRLFEPFVQGNRTVTAKTPGLGLGLSIARGLLRQGGGDLVARYDLPGAVFELRLPRPPEQTSHAP